MPPEIVGARPGDSACAGWIQSPAFDLTFFILSPMAGLLLLLASPTGVGPVLAIAAATLIGGPHYLATYSFYFWDDTAGYHRERWIAYFLVPILIVAAVGIVALFHIPFVIIVVVYFWNAFHVSRQSCGILTIYRQHAGVSDPQQKSAANAAIISTNGAMAFANIEWYPALHDFLSLPSPLVPVLLSQAVILAAVVCLARLALALYRRSRNGPAFTVPEVAFLGTSLLLFHPYLWIEDF